MGPEAPAEVGVKRMRPLAIADTPRAKLARQLGSAVDDAEMDEDWVRIPMSELTRVATELNEARKATIRFKQTLDQVSLNISEILKASL